MGIAGDKPFCPQFAESDSVPDRCAAWRRKSWDARATLIPRRRELGDRARVARPARRALRGGGLGHRAVNVARYEETVLCAHGRTYSRSPTRRSNNFANSGIVGAVFGRGEHESVCDA